MTKYSTTLARMGGILLLAGAAVVGSTSQAEAAFVAAICNDAACTGGGDIIVTDNALGDADFLFGPALTSGFIVAGGSVDGFEVTLNAAQTKPIFGSAEQPMINLSYSLNNLTGGLAGPIYLYAGDTDFTGEGIVRLAVNSTSPGQDTVGEALGGDNNTVGAAGLNLNPLLASASANGVFSTVISGPFVPTASNPYALTAGVVVSNATLGAHTGDITVSVVPEPATMALFGLGLFGAGIAARRRKQAQTVA
jgi:hypothetical protein